MAVPADPKIYHIVHVDRLASIIADGELFSDARMADRPGTGTVVGMNRIKERRLLELKLECHPDLYVGQCVPFYFCPRSVMLFLLHMGNHQDLTYHGGQEPILHLEADLHATVQWADENNIRWAFTLSNAGAYYFDDRNDLNLLDEIDWEAVEARNWKRSKDGKQAEFLIENGFSWELVERIGVHSQRIGAQVVKEQQHSAHKPRVEIIPDWYY